MPLIKSVSSSLLFSRFGENVVSATFFAVVCVAKSFIFSIEGSSDEFSLRMKKKLESPREVVRMMTEWNALFFFWRSKISFGWKNWRTSWRSVFNAGSEMTH